MLISASLLPLCARETPKLREKTAVGAHGAQLAARGIPVPEAYNREGADYLHKTFKL